MKLRGYLLTLLVAIVLMLAMSVSCFAESHSFKGSCSFDGDKITGDFDKKKVDAAVEGLEPGDELTYEVTYKNDSDEKTDWYMKNNVLKTLEESKDPAENGGYTYVLKNIAPKEKDNKTLFDNSEVGGEVKVAKLEGLKQATNATKDYFFIQQLEPGESAKTNIKVAFDGETEVNDYMDTSGALMVQYAVETADTGKNKNKKRYVYNTVKTGDPTDLILPIVLMAVGAVVLVLAILGWKRSRRREDGDEA